MAKSYVTLTQMKSTGYLNIASITDYDTDLLRILQNASEEIDHICHRHFDCWEGIQYFDGSGRTLLPNEDILSITSIDLDSDGSGDYASALTATSYLSYPLGGFEQYPKLYLKLKLNASYGGFAPGIPGGVKITGVFGYGDGIGATPYYDSGITVTVATSAGTTLTLSAEGTIQPGHTIRVESEQIYINTVTSNGSKTATCDRGVNGTTAAIHTAKSAYIYKYPGPIVESTLILATNWWKQRENPTVFKAGNSITGEYQITEDIEKMLTKRLSHHIRRHLR